MATKWYNIASKNEGGDTVATVDIFGEIGWEVRANQFIREHRATNATRTLVNINSPGGSVIDGFAIYNYLLGIRGTVTTQVVGLAGSAASIILQAGSKRKMPKNGFVLIHNASAGVLGGADEMEKAAAELRKINALIEAIYVARTGSSEEDIKKAMEDDMLLDSEESLKLGLVDEVTEGISFTARCDREVVGRYSQAALAKLDELAGKGNDMALGKLNLFGGGPSEREKFLASAVEALGVNIEELVAGKDPKAIKVAVGKREKFLEESISALGLDVGELVAGNDPKALKVEIESGCKSALDEKIGEIQAHAYGEISKAIGATVKKPEDILAHIDAIKAEVPKQIAGFGSRKSTPAKAGADLPEPTNNHERVARNMAAWAESQIAAAKGGVK